MDARCALFPQHGRSVRTRSLDARNVSSPTL
jgi:hypothetical protein